MNTYTKATEKIAITKMCGSKKVAMQMYGTHSLNEDGTVIPFDEQMAMQNIGGRCVFSSEWDTQAQKIYLLNDGEVPFGDITTTVIQSFIP